MAIITRLAWVQDCLMQCSFCATDAPLHLRCCSKSEKHAPYIPFLITCVPSTCCVRFASFATLEQHMQCCKDAQNLKCRPMDNVRLPCRPSPQVTSNPGMHSACQSSISIHKKVPFNEQYVSQTDNTWRSPSNACGRGSVNVSQLQRRLHFIGKTCLRKVAEQIRRAETHTMSNASALHPVFLLWPTNSIKDLDPC